VCDNNDETLAGCPRFSSLQPDMDFHKVMIEGNSIIRGTESAPADDLLADEEFDDDKSWNVSVDVGDLACEKLEENQSRFDASMPLSVTTNHNKESSMRSRSIDTSGRSCSQDSIFTNMLDESVKRFESEVDQIMKSFRHDLSTAYHDSVDASSDSDDLQSKVNTEISSDNEMEKE